MAVADLAKALPVAGRRHQAAAGVLHRFGDHHRDRRRVLELDRFLDLVEQGLAERGFVVAVRVPVVAGVADVDGRNAERIEGGPADRDAGEGKCSHGHPVVGVLAGDHLAAALLAHRLLPLDRHLPGGLDRFRTAGSEVDLVHPFGGQRGDLLGQFDRRRMGDRPVGRVGQLLHLLVGGRADLVAIRMAERGAVKAGKTVDVTGALVIEDVDSLAPLDDRDARPPWLTSCQRNAASDAASPTLPDHSFQSLARYRSLPSWVRVYPPPSTKPAACLWTYKPD